MPHASMPSSKFQPASSAPAAHSGAFSSLLRCEGVYKSYHLSGRDVPALRGIDLSIDQPGFYAIMGQSGSGKSTLLHLLAALDKPDRGQVFVSGKPLHELD